MSELTPLEILGTTFSRKLQGYAPDEVHRFLSQVASAVEGLLRERGETRQKLHRLEQELAGFREREQALQQALVAAQRSAENTLEAARLEAQRLVDEGQALADRLVEEAQERARNVERVTGDLRTRRREVRADLMRLVEVLEGVVRDDQENEHKERSTPQLAVLGRRPSQTSETQR